MQLMLPIFLGATLVLFGFIFVTLSLRWLNSDELSGRLQNFVVESHEQGRDWIPESVLRQREYTGSIFTRLILPNVRRFFNFFGRLTPAGMLDGISRQLQIAGYPMNLGAREFFGIRVAFTILAFGVAFLIMRRSFRGLDLLLGVLVLIALYYLPYLWLRQRIFARQDGVRKGLPDALDMLSVCASAGLGFEQAMQRVSEHWKTQVGAEFGRAIAEVEMGVSRQDALRNMADRIDVSELSSFVSLILQSDQLGMSISDTLHSQAEQMRIERRYRAQEEARKIPIKMLVPMALLIFPAIIAVVLGPAIPQLVGFFSTFGG